MEERIRQALGHVQAEDALKEKTINAVTHRLYSRKKQMLSRKKSLMAVVACLVVMLIGGGWVYATPTATIGINNESTLILKTNRWGRVIFVLTVGRDFQQVQTAQHGGFAGAGRADHHHHITPVDVYRYIIQRAQRAFIEMFLQVLDLDQFIVCRHGSFSFRSGQ